jgi:hypothetical protein
MPNNTFMSFLDQPGLSLSFLQALPATETPKGAIHALITQFDAMLVVSKAEKRLPTAANLAQPQLLNFSGNKKNKDTKKHSKFRCLRTFFPNHFRSPFHRCGEEFWGLGMLC